MYTIMYSLFLTLSLSACSSQYIGEITPIISASQTNSKEIKVTNSDSSVYQIQIMVGDQTFSTVLYKNETTDALMERFPLNIDMGELNGNEKFYYLPNSLPVNSERPSEIHIGDLMLYGPDCLVLFYENFSSSFSYTKLGYVEDADALASALGNGNVHVSFNVE